MITHKGPLTADEFMAWLKDGKDMLPVECTNAWACFIKVSKQDGIDYIFHQKSHLGTESLPNCSIPFRFSGLYVKNEQTLYCPCFPDFAISDWQAVPANTELCLRKEFCQRVRERIEEMVNNGRIGIPKELTDENLKAEVAEYIDHQADESAAWSLMDSVPHESIAFKSRYVINDLYDCLPDYLQDRKGFVDRTATAYISLHKEEILAELMRMDAHREKYAAILADPDNPLHRMKQISDAVRSSRASTVLVTIEKDGAQATIRTSAKSLSGYHPTYNDFDSPAADRKAFREAFGSWATYTVQDIRCITRGKKTLYEAPELKAAQSEAPQKGFTMAMGGM